MPGLSPSCNISSLGAVIQDIGVSCLSEGEQYLRRLIVVTEYGVSFILSGSGKLSESSQPTLEMHLLFSFLWLRIAKLPSVTVFTTTEYQIVFIETSNKFSWKYFKDSFQKEA